MGALRANDGTRRTVETQPKDLSRREEVLDRAVEYLADNGLSNFTMRKLAAAMGTSTNTISYQFGSKEGLIDAALERARSMTLGALERIREEQPGIDPYSALEDLWSWWMLDHRNRFATRLNMEAMVASDDDVPRERRPGLMTFWIDYFSAWIKDSGRTDTRHSIVRATQLMAMMSGAVSDLQSTQDVERVQAALYDFLNMLREEQRLHTD